MTRFYLYFILAISFGTKAQIASIDTLYQAKTSIRAIACADGKLYYGANSGNAGIIDLKTKAHQQFHFPDAARLEFRSIAQTKSHWLLLTAGNPALLYRISKKDGTYTCVYREEGDRVFYDSMIFTDNKHGLALGDPASGTFAMLETQDGGLHWSRLPANQAPQAQIGEAAFAASNSNLSFVKNQVWAFSGGVKARVFKRQKNGNWTAFDTPFTQGGAMTGIFSGSFYNASQGFITGGDYESPQSNHNNKARTLNGGKSWELVSPDAGFGYASCVQYVPKSKGKELVSLGATGLWYSRDGGLSWSKLHDSPNWYTLRFVDRKTFVVAGRNEILRISFKK